MRVVNDSMSDRQVSMAMKRHLASVESPWALRMAAAVRSMILVPVPPKPMNM